jgi:Fic family protein
MHSHAAITSDNHRTHCGEYSPVRRMDGAITADDAANAEQTLVAVFYKAKLWQRINRGPVNDRQRRVINRLLDAFEGVLTTSKYAKLAGCSPDTALRDIRELLERGILVQNPARGRSTSYRLADPEGVSA